MLHCFNLDAKVNSLTIRSLVLESYDINAQMNPCDPDNLKEIPVFIKEACIQEKINNYTIESKQKMQDDFESCIKITKDLDVAIDGNKLQRIFYPEVSAQIFLSHSHLDEDLVKEIKFVFEKEFDIQVFVDSFVWEYCDNLIRNLEIKLEGKVKYPPRNQLKTIVDTILTTMLARMIYNCELVFFLNTDKSNLINYTTNEVKTDSPWIYYELSIIQLMKAMRQDAVNMDDKQLVNVNENKELKSFYEISMKDFKTITLSDLLECLKEVKKEHGDLRKGHELIREIYKKCNAKSYIQLSDS